MEVSKKVGLSLSAFYLLKIKIKKKTIKEYLLLPTRGVFLSELSVFLEHRNSYRLLNY